MKKLLIVSMILGSQVFAGGSHYTEYVSVVKSKPTYEHVITRVPYQECRNVNVPARYSNYRNSHNNYQRADSGTAIVGGIIGGVLGHQIGKGHGKDVATIGGAIIGSLIGQNSRRPQRYNAVYDSGYSSCQTQRRCTTRYREVSERRFMGYKNIAYYKGRKIVRYSDRRLATIPINVTIDY